MSEQAVTLDMSTAQPLAPPPPVKLDMSTAQPINPPSTLDKVAAKLPGTADTGLKGAVTHLPQTWDAVKSTIESMYDVSAPGIATELYKKFTGQPNNLKDVPRKIVTQGVPLMLGPEAEAAEAATPGVSATAVPAAAAAEDAASGPLSRAAEVAKRRLSNLPGVRAVKDLDYIVRGGEDAATTPPTPPTPTVPPSWGQGRYGTPVDQWGTRIPPTPAAAPAAEPPPAATPPAAAAEPAATTPPRSQNLDAPRPISGESALRQVLTGQDNQNLMRIARSRGLDVTKEAQLKPGVADKLLVNKIIDDFSDDELDDLRSSFIENTRMGRHNFGDIGAEANKTLAMQTYFPDVKVPLATTLRTQKAIQAAAAPKMAPVGDLTSILEQSLKLAQQQKASQ